MHTARHTSAGNKNALLLPSCKSNCKTSPKKPPDQSHARHIPRAWSRAWLGNKTPPQGPRRAPSKHGTWQLRSRLHVDRPCTESVILEKRQRETSAKKNPTVLSTEDKREGLIYLLYNALANPHFEYCMNSASSS